LPPPAPPEPEPVEVLVPAEVLVALDVAAEVLVAADVVPAPVVAAADMLAPPPSPPPTWQFGFVLAPTGQQMSELPSSTVFDVQTRPRLVSQSSLPVVGSVGVAETLRSQRWPSPWSPQPGALRTATASAAATTARIA
jgi:hypothetical protein